MQIVRYYIDNDNVQNARYNGGERNATNDIGSGGWWAVMYQLQALYAALHNDRRKGLWAM